MPEYKCLICGAECSVVEHRIYSKKPAQEIIETRFSCKDETCGVLLIIPGEEQHAVKRYQERSENAEKVILSLLSEVAAVTDELNQSLVKTVECAGVEL